MTDKVTHIGDLVIDRSRDCPPPGHPERNYQEAHGECLSCGRLTIVMLDIESGRLLRPPVARWYWKCFGCGTTEEGGAWIPRTAEEYHYSRWLAAQEESDVDTGTDRATGEAAAAPEAVRDVLGVEAAGAAGGERGPDRVVPGRAADDAHRASAAAGREDQPADVQRLAAGEGE